MGQQMADSRVVTQLIVDARGAKEGSAQYDAAMKMAQGAVDAYLTRQEKLQAAVSATGQVLTRGAGSVDRLARQYAALQASVDPVVAAQQKASRAVEQASKVADDAVRRLGKSQSEAAALVSAVREKYDAATAAVARNAVAANDNSAALAKVRAQFDPVFAAQLRYKGALEQVNSALAEGAIGENLAMQARMKAASQMNDTIQKLERMAQAQKASVERTVSSQTITPDRAADIAAYGEALDALQAKYDPVFRAEQAYTAGMEELQQVFRLGIISQEVYAARSAEMGAALDKAVAAAAGLTQAVERQEVVIDGAAAAQARFNELLGVQASSSATGNRAAEIEAYGLALQEAQERFEPLTAAAGRYARGTAEVNQLEAAGALSANTAAQARLALTRVYESEAQAIEGVAAAQKRSAEALVVATQVSQGTTTRDRGEDIAAYGKALTDLEHSLDPVKKAEAQYAEALELANRGLATGAVQQDQYEKAVARARTTLLNQKTEIAKADEANRRLASGAGLTAYGFQNLSYQINDVVTSIGAGISPMQTLFQQGGQIYQILQQGQGGVGGALKGIADRLREISPLAGVFGIMAAAAALAVTAMYSVSSAQEKTRLGLSGIGETAGLTAEQFDSIAVRAAKSAVITVGAAREIGQEFLKSGTLIGQNYEKAEVAAALFAKATGQEGVQAAQQLVAALSDINGPGLEDLAKKTGAFDGKVVDATRDLQAQGRELEAQGLILDRILGKYGDINSRLGGITRAFQAVKAAASQAFTESGEAALGGQGSSELMAAQRSLAAAKRAADRVGRGGAPQSNEEIAARRRVDEITAALKRQETQTAATAQTTKNAVRSVDTTVTKQTVKPYADYETAIKNATKARQEFEAIDDAGRGDKSSERYKAAKESLDANNAAVRDYIQNGGAQAAVISKVKAVQAANNQAQAASTLEQKQAAAAAQSFAQSQNDAISPTERLRRALQARAEVGGQANAEATKQSTASQATAAANLAEADAVSKNTKSVAALKAARQADMEVKTQGAPADRQQVRQQEVLKEQLAEAVRAQAEATRARQQDTQGTEAAVAAANKRVGAAAEQVRQLQRNIEIGKMQVEVDAAEGQSKEALKTQLDRTAESYDSLQSAQQKLQVLQMRDDSQRGIEYLEREAQLLGATNLERQTELATLRAKQQLQSQGISLNTAESQDYINREKLRGSINAARDDFTKLASDVSQAIGGVFDDLFTQAGGGIKKTIDSITKNFAKIGSSLIQDQLLKPLISGSLSGQGSSAGGLFNLKDVFNSAEVTKAVEKGSSAGVGGAFDTLLKPKTDASGKTGGFATSPLGSGLLAGVAGASIGYQTQSPLMGALGGGLSGFAAGAAAGGTMGPIGAVIGAGAGLLGGLFGQSQAKKAREKQIKQQLQEYKDAYNAAKPQIEAMERTFTQNEFGGVRQNIQNAFSQAVQANMTASKGGDQATADRIMKEFESYANILRENLGRALGGTMKELSEGFGMNGAFNQAAEGLNSLGSNLRGFVNDTKELNDAALTEQARTAATQALVLSLSKAPELDEYMTRYQQIQGALSQLGAELQALGVAAEDVGKMVDAGLTNALTQLRDQFTGDLQAKINTANGKDYLNDASDFMKEIRTLGNDQARLGADPMQVEAYFRVGAQRIVDDAKLTGDAFGDLTARFPDLIGRVHEYSAAADEASSSTDSLADRLKGYADRLFEATNDSSTLAGALAVQDRKAAADRATEAKSGNQGVVELERALAAERQQVLRQFAEQAFQRAQGFNDRYYAAITDTTTLAGSLAAFDRKAAQERLAEASAGGVAMVQLEAALGAERAKVYQTYAEQALTTANSTLDTAKSALKSAYDTESAALKTTIDRLTNFTAAIRKFRDSLLTNTATTTLSPEERLAEARRQYEENLAKAKAGDETAQGNVQELASTFLDAAKAYYASSTDYADIFDSVQKGLTDVADAGDAQARIAQAQLTALQQQVGALISIDTGVKSVAQAIAELVLAMQAQASAAVAAKAAAAAATPAAQNAAFLDNAYQQLLGRTPDAGGSAYFTDQLNSGSSQSSIIGSITGSAEYQLNQIYQATLGRNVDQTGYAGFGAQLAAGASAQSIIEQIKTSQEYAALHGLVNGGIVGAFAEGGFVGNGRYNRDSVVARYAGGGTIALAGGEAVIPAAATARNRNSIAAMIAGRSSNDNGDTRALLGAVNRLADIVYASHEETKAILTEGNEATADTGRQIRKFASKG